MRIFRDTNVYHEASGFGHLEVISLLMLSFLASKVEPQFNEPLYNEVLGITNDFLYLSSSKIYEKQPRYNETLLWPTKYASHLTLRYIEVPL